MAEAGFFTLSRRPSEVKLTLYFPESFASDDSIQLNLTNLKFVRQYVKSTIANNDENLRNKPIFNDPEESDAEGETYFVYMFGPKFEHKLRIRLNQTPAFNYGIIEVFLGDNIISRGAADQGYDLFFALNTRLQAEATRQEAIRAAARARGRNVATLKQTLAGPTGLDALDSGAAGSIVGSFLSGKPGSLNQQVAALKKNAAVPNARRRKTRRNRK